jgi:hypothetical protein
MGYKPNEYMEQILKNQAWKKVFSPTHLNTLLDFLVNNQLIPSQVSINRALSELNFRRTDGGSAASDYKAEVKAAQQTLDQVIAETTAAPLTRAELAHFASLSFPELQRKYWGDDNDAINSFAIRYNKAAREQGYRIPDRPQIANVVDDDKGFKLSAAEYHALPAREVCKRLQDPAFKRAVDRLIKQGVI